jgi:CheY-like chemotaxis protein
MNPDQELKLEKKVLYVEDDTVNCLVMKGLLQRYSINVEIATTAHEAVLKAKRFLFPLILMDINLGEEETDGILLSRELRALPGYEACPIFAITAYPELHLTMGEERGIFQRYFYKPFNRDELAQAILGELSPS